MNEPRLEVKVERDPDGLLSVRTPRVGLWSDLPGAGELLGPGSSIGLLRQLERRFRLVLPEGAEGRVRFDSALPRVVPVEYGQLLLRLVGLDRKPAVGEAQADAKKVFESLPDGAAAVICPTDGVFYRRSAADAPPFVEVGTRVRNGQVVGLVEVMKTFNQIQYGGDGLPDEAEVIEIRAQEGEEIRAGQILVVVR